MLCKVTDCHGKRVLIPRKDAPTFRTRPKKRGGNFEGTIVHPLVPHPSNLCYYHLKKEEKYFGTKHVKEGKFQGQGPIGKSSGPYVISHSGKARDISEDQKYGVPVPPRRRSTATFPKFV